MVVGVPVVLVGLTRVDDVYLNMSDNAFDVAAVVIFIACTESTEREDFEFLIS